MAGFGSLNKFRCALVALFALAVLGNLACAQNPAVNVFSGVVLTWEPLIMLIAFIMFLVVTIFYMFALALNNSKLKMWCKSEYMQVLATFIVAASLVGFIDLGTKAASDVTRDIVAASTGQQFPANAGPSPSELTKAYLTSSIDCVKSMYRYAYSYALYFEPMERTNIDVGGVEPVAGSWFVGGIVSLTHYIGNRLTYVLILQYVQYRLVDFFQATMLTFFLPVGLIFRTFPLTRGIGGFLIALSIGCYFIFPLSYMVIIAVQGNIASGCAVTNLPQAPNSAVCAGSMPDALIRAQLAKQSISSASDALNRVANFVALISLQSVFFPIVALIMVFTFVRSTSNLLGADLAELGRGLVKII